MHSAPAFRVVGAWLAPVLAAVTLACTAKSGEQRAVQVTGAPPSVAPARVATEPTPSARVNAEPEPTEASAPQPVPLYLGAWLVEHGAPTDSKEVVENESTYCERVLHVGRPAEEAIQCQVIVDSSGHLELDGHVCKTAECLHAFMVRTRIFLRRESKLRTALDVPTAVHLRSDGGGTEYITAYVEVAEDGLLADVTVDGSCGQARDGVREHKKESSVPSALWRFIAGAVDQVCAAQGHYTWSGGKFRR